MDSRDDEQFRLREISNKDSVGSDAMISDCPDIAQRLMEDALRWIVEADARSLWRALEAGGLHARFRVVDDRVEPSIEQADHVDRPASLTVGLPVARLFGTTIAELAHGWSALGAPMDGRSLRAWFVSEPAVQNGVRLCMLADVEERADVFRDLAAAWAAGSATTSRN